MSIAIVTGSCGLVGSAAVAHFSALGMEVIGIDNDMRAEFFGAEASTRWKREELAQIPTYQHHAIDLRDFAAIHRIFRRYQSDIALVIHAGAQPSHDWAAQNPTTDFEINAVGTLTMLEATRIWAPQSVFIFLSTNKVYGDMPNLLPLIEYQGRWDISEAHEFFNGITEELTIDDSMHSLFGVSKLSADLMVQEYRNYFGMKTGVFRCGCLSGANHSGAREHGFLSYLMRSAIEGRPYTIYGYKGKQVRDNLHSHDLMEAFSAFFSDPESDPEDVGAVYNLGGGRESNCSVLEAIDIAQNIVGDEMQLAFAGHRRGDHIWWITSNARFQERYPSWRVHWNVHTILKEIYLANRERWCRK